MPVTAAPALPSPLADVAAGQVPAVSIAPIKRGEPPDPAQEFVVTNFPDVEKALGYYEAQDLHSVLYNPDLISEKQLQEADQAGKLLQIAPLVRELKPAAPAAPTAPAEAPTAPLAAAAPIGRLAGAKVPGGNVPGLNSARLANVRPAPVNAPNPVPGQLAKRAV